MNIQQGLDFVLSHFEYPNHYFPRTVSTKETQNRQIEIYSKEEAIDYFFKAGFKDCRIAAFGKYEQEIIIPNIIFVDLDNREALNEVLILFHKTIGAKPTVLDTGNGCAILQPIKMKPWNDRKHSVSHKGKQPDELSKLFLQWTERYLTNYKCDLGNHPSLKNTMIRIPGSYNSKKLEKTNYNYKESRVIVKFGWDKNRIEIKNIIPAFIRHLNKIIAEENKLAKIDRKANPKNYQWIDELMNHNLEDGRARLLFDVSRYLINLKGYSIEEAVKKIDSWLNSRFYSKSIIKFECKRALKDGKYPRRIGTIKSTDQGLYEILPEEIKI